MGHGFLPCFYILTFLMVFISPWVNAFAEKYPAIVSYEPVCDVALTFEVDEDLMVERHPIDQEEMDQ